MWKNCSRRSAIQKSNICWTLDIQIMPLLFTEVWVIQPCWWIWGGNREAWGQGLVKEEEKPENYWWPEKNTLFCHQSLSHDMFCNLIYHHWKVLQKVGHRFLSWFTEMITSFLKATLKTWNLQVTRSVRFLELVLGGWWVDHWVWNLCVWWSAQLHPPTRPNPIQQHSPTHVLKVLKQLVSTLMIWWADQAL